MKKTLVLFALILALGGVYGQTLVYYWNFNQNTPPTDTTWDQPIMAAVGDAEITYTFTEAFSFAGTTLNGEGGEVNGGSFAPRGGADTVNNGAYFTIHASTVGLDNIVMSYPTRRTSTGFNTQEVKYTVNGSDWITKYTLDLTDFENGWVAGQMMEVDFSGTPGVANNPNFAIRVVLTGCTTAAGNNRIDNIRITAASQGAAAMPVFDPPAGAYTQPINVAISSSTPGATIHYTTDGSNPTQSSPSYSNPIPVSSTTTIKAIAYASGLDASNVATATYMFPVVVQNMSQLRAQTAGDGTVYLVSGEVLLTFKQSFRNQKYVQDANAGVLVDDPDGKITSIYQIGDGITGIVGTIAYYANLLQFTPVGDPGAATSHGNNIYAPTITINELNMNVANYQGRLIRIANANFVESGNFEVGQNYTLQDATGTVVFRTTFYDVDYIQTEIPSGNFNILVLVNQFNQTPQVTARGLDDWSSTPNDDEVNVPKPTQLIGNHPNPFNPHTTISFHNAKAEPVQIVIYNTKGQIVKTWNLEATTGTHSLSWDGRDDSGNAVSSGVYYYRMQSGKYSSTRKMVLMK
ncbi:MAG: T9SS type A sorting domain-containing protein [Candidatus Cloacimonetes bacterium]|nr:T9SS type A sorting domain-containing protein [Candidatus Cloacimonadota bacterium]